MNICIKDELAFRAQTQGHLVAIQSLHHTIKYDHLYRFTSHAITHFSKLGIQPGQRVLIACPDDAMNLMLALSLMRMGAISCLNHGWRDFQHADSFDWVMTHQESQDIPAKKWIPINKNLIQQINQADLYAGPDQAADLGIILLSSGTTGTHKKIGLSPELLMQRVYKFQRIFPIESSMNLMRLSTALGINHALQKILWGETLYLADNDLEALEMMRRHKIKTLIASPIQLSQLITQLNQADFANTLERVIYSGSMAHQKLLENIRQKLCKEIHVYYGSSEMGGLCGSIVPESNPMGIAGFLMPGVQLEIQSKSNDPKDEWGLIRIQAEHAVDGYLDDPITSQQFFKEGWFYPGDEGRLIQDHLLVLNQRESDILNIGGVKLNPLIIENQLHQTFNIDDLAIFELILPSGQGVVALAHTGQDRNSPLSVETIRAKLKNQLAPIQIPQYIFTVNQIPRNVSGKVLRKQLTNIISKNFLQDKK